MRDPFAHVKSGQPIEIAHQSWNAMLDAAKAFRSGERIDAGVGGAGVVPANLVVVRNDSGGALPAFSVLAPTAALVSPDDLPYEVRRRPCFAASTPTDATNQPLVTVEAIPSGQFGLAAAAGVVPVAVAVTSSAHLYAVPVKGDTTKLTSAKSGPARLLAWPDATASGGRAVVLLGESPVVATPGYGGIPSSLAECASVQIPCPPPPPSSAGDAGVITDWFALGGDTDTGGDFTGYNTPCLTEHADDPTACQVKTACASALLPARFAVLVCNGTGKFSYYADNPATVLATYSPNTPSGWYFAHTAPDRTATVNGRLQCCSTTDPNLYFVGNLIGFDPAADDDSCGCEFQFTCACTGQQTLLTELSEPEPTEVLRLDAGCGTVDLYVMPYSAPQPPVADFVGTPLVGDAPLAVAFTDLSLNFPTSWVWDFGDGSTGSILQNPTHVYSAPGTYPVTLTARNSVGYDAKTKINYITARAANVHAADDAYTFPTDGSTTTESLAANDTVPAPDANGSWTLFIVDNNIPNTNTGTLDGSVTFGPYDLSHSGVWTMHYRWYKNGQYSNIATVTVTIGSP